MSQVSVITVCLNSERTIADTMNSVLAQTGVSVEHVVKDGGSTDRTTEIAAQTNPDAKIIVGPDAGLYDAMNHGFAHCTGEIVGFLNADDYYAAPDVLQSVFEVFQKTACAMAYGDITIVDLQNRVVREWRSAAVRGGSLRGRQLPHPALFVRRDVLERLERPFDPSYRISADVKQQLILIEKLGLQAEYLARVLTIMRTGGQSSRSLRALALGWAESARAYREVHQRPGWLFATRKSMTKLSQIRIPLVAPGDSL